MNDKEGSKFVDGNKKILLPSEIVDKKFALFFCILYFCTSNN